MQDWDDIIRQHGSSVWKIAWRILANESDAADCFQETFLAVVRIAARERVESWGGLLCRVATLQAVRILHNRAKRKSLSIIDDSLISRTPNNDSPVQNVESTELVDLLREALAELPSDVAAVISLRYELQMSYAEIGRALGISVNHVGVLLHRGKQQLQVRLRSVLAE